MGGNNYAKCRCLDYWKWRCGASCCERALSRKECDNYHKKTGRNNNTHLAQGGIAAAVATYDDPSGHFEDTLVAGCHYNNEEAVRYLVEEGPKEISKLITNGMKFDGDEKGMPW